MVIEWFPTREREREREKKKRIERLSHTSGQVEYEQHVRYQEDLLSALIFLWKPFFFRHILHKKLKLLDFLYVSCRRRYIFNALVHSCVLFSCRMTLQAVVMCRKCVLINVEMEISNFPLWKFNISDSVFLGFWKEERRRKRSRRRKKASSRWRSLPGMSLTSSTTSARRARRARRISRAREP